MNSKKLLITIGVIVVILIVGTLLWKGGFSWLGVGIAPSTSPTEGITPGTQPGVEEQAGEQTMGEQTEVGSIGKMTDEIYIEIAVQIAYQSQKDPVGLEQAVKNLLNKYGVTQENMDAYSATINKDTARAQAVAQKYMQRLQELQKTGE